MNKIVEIAGNIDMDKLEAKAKEMGDTIKMIECYKDLQGYKE
jgi:hypothetical protein